MVRCIDCGGVRSGDGGGHDCRGNSGGEGSGRDICVTSESLLPNLIMFLSLLLTCQETRKKSTPKSEHQNWDQDQ